MDHHLWNLALHLVLRKKEYKKILDNDDRDGNCFYGIITQDKKELSVENNLQTCGHNLSERPDFSSLVLLLMDHFINRAN